LRAFSGGKNTIRRNAWVKAGGNVLPVGVPGIGCIWTPENSKRALSVGGLLWRIGMATYPTRTIAVLFCLLTSILVLAGTTVIQAQDQDHHPTCPGERRALVLGGGGIRGAYQIGALWYLINVLNCDFDHYVGTSTGALSAAVLAQAKDHHDLQHRIEVLVQQYANLHRQDQLLQARMFAKIRLFLPHWLGGLDGLYSLEPVDTRLRTQIDFNKMRSDNLTVTAVSLQSGPLDFFEPVMPVDYVIGSASIPFAVDPKEARLWIRGVVVLAEDRIVVISTPFPPGLPDENCKIKLSEQIIARCKQMASAIDSYIELTASGNEYQIWHTTLRVFDIPDDTWRKFSDTVRGERASFDERLMSLLGSPTRRYRTVDDLMKAWETGLLVYFTTRHQLVDGGVLENLPVLTAAALYPRIDTLFVVSTGDTLLSDKNEKFSGAADIGERAFEVLWERYQQAALRNVESLWSNYTYLGTKQFRNPFLPKLIIIRPWQRFFKDTFDVAPKAIQDALMHGCDVASSLASARLDDQFVRVRYDETNKKSCDPLRDIITDAKPKIRLRTNY
jgi:predicted acylesterase/phospholipase RssA